MTNLPITTEPVQNPDRWTPAIMALQAMLDRRPWDVPNILYTMPYGDLATLAFACGQLRDLADRAYDVVTGAEDL